MKMRTLLILVAIALAGGLAATLYHKNVPGGNGGRKPGETGPTTSFKEESPITRKGDGRNTPQEAFVLTEEIKEQIRRDNEEEARLIQKYYDEMSDEDKAAKPANVSTERWAIYGAELEESAKDNGDVVFFGKVVDESGTPLPNVAVSWELLGKHSSLAEVMEKGSKTKTFFENWSMNEKSEVETDATGRFEITDRRGTSLSIIDFKLEGFAWDKKGKWHFKFGSDAYLARGDSVRHQADPENPVVYVLRKK
ncbi:MAG: carboxypeptidase regulatory-like domain-containing protein [Verrucomicrobiae bacterium]|nr:carboxypeptidase regulatory-like domain-containing protein [Verrucomicrobiae bacterium]